MLSTAHQLPLSCGEHGLAWLGLAVLDGLCLMGLGLWLDGLATRLVW